MKIAILCPYSYPSICGVWTRVYNDAKYLVSKGHEVHILSSNEIKGTDKKSKFYEFYQGIHIHRFPFKKITEHIRFFDFKKELYDINPSIIHTHLLRHPHSLSALKYAKELEIPCFLTTHAPFVSKKVRGTLRYLLEKSIDHTLTRATINKYTKIITITKWEEPFLFKYGAKKQKIIYIPNGIPKELLTLKRTKRKQKRILFLGRIAPVKGLETLIKAYTLIKNPPQITIVGPKEKGYNIQFPKNFEVKDPVYDEKEKMKLYQESDIFVLPSKREAMPQSLIEAKAAGLTVISSKTSGGKEMIQDNSDGYLFDIGNAYQLAELITTILKTNQEQVQRKARSSVQHLTLEKLGEKLEKLYLKK